MVLEVSVHGQPTPVLSELWRWRGRSHDKGICLAHGGQDEEREVGGVGPNSPLKGTPHNDLSP